METISRNVRDLKADERSVFERVVGHALGESQKIVLNVFSIEASDLGAGDSAVVQNVPTHWKIYDGLSDAEIDELDKEIKRSSNPGRDVE